MTKAAQNDSLARMPFCKSMTAMPQSAKLIRHVDLLFGKAYVVREGYIVYLNARLQSFQLAEPLWTDHLSVTLMNLSKTYFAFFKLPN